MLAHRARFCQLTPVKMETDDPSGMDSPDDAVHRLLDGLVIPAEEIASFRTGVRRVSIRKGDFFLRPGRVCTSVGFVAAGLLRSYVATEGKEYNIEFYAERQFAAAYTSLLTRQPTEWSIQALEDTELVVVPVALLDELYERHRCWLAFGKRLFEEQTVKKCRREKSLIRDDATVRYALFREEYAAIEPRLSLLHVASYLGVEPETLSRIRKKARA